MSPYCLLFGKCLAITRLQNSSISQWKTFSPPIQCAARAKPPIPLNKCPHLSFCIPIFFYKVHHPSSAPCPLRGPPISTYSPAPSALDISAAPPCRKRRPSPQSHSRTLFLLVPCTPPPLT